MHTHRLWFTLAFAALVGCAVPGEPEADWPVGEGPRDQLICKGLLDHFIGLPEATTPLTTSAPDGDVIAGRWWIRRCAMHAVEGALELRLRGPGWYWVDLEQGDIRLHQQVPFELDVKVAGTFRAAYSEGIVSFWFEPVREPVIELVASTDLDVQGTNVWGWFLRYMPFFPLRSIVAKHLSKSAAAALRHDLGHGATITYDILRGQSDIALGQLGIGETPRHRFEDRATWLVNERLRLPAGAAQVVGPFDPALRRGIDVAIDAGPGIAYQVLCQAEVHAQLPSIVSGTPGAIPKKKVLASGTIEGPGRHSGELRVSACSYCLVVSSLRERESVIALRVRE